MKINRLILLMIILAGMAVYFGCRKIDRQIDKTAVSLNESKFFSNHASSNPLVQALTGFVKRENNKYHFVDKWITQIG
jgi:hypothetical protein